MKVSSDDYSQLDGNIQKCPQTTNQILFWTIIEMVSASHQKTSWDYSQQTCVEKKTFYGLYAVMV